MSNGKCQPGFQEIVCNIIFDINMEGNFTRKERLVAGVHITDPQHQSHTQASYLEIASASHSCSLS